MGDLDFEYQGGFHLTVEATVKIDLPLTTAYTVPIVVSVTIKRVHGRVGFTCLPSHTC